MGRLIRKAAVCAVLSGSMMLFGGAGTASAVPLDSWSTAQSVINSAAGTSRCTIGASTPVQSNNIMAGSASINCNQNYAELSITVCIMAKPALLPEADWVEAGCAPEKVATDEDRLTHSATAQCLPGNMLYRTQAKAHGIQVGDTEENPTFTMVFHGSSVNKSCGVV